MATKKVMKTAKKAAPAKKVAPKKVVKAPAKKVAPKKATPAKKVPAKKAAPAKKVVKAPAKKVPAKKAAPKKAAPAKKVPAKKAVAKKAPAEKKVVAKKELPPKKEKKMAPPPKKTMSKERKQLEHKLVVLVNKGRDRGFITFDEILRVFPEIENHIDFLEEVYERMADSGVNMIESGGLLDVKTEDEPVAPTGASRKYLTTKSSPYDST